ncbi:MAG: riboflavin synthase, partial [Methylobacter sp.]
MFTGIILAVGKISAIEQKSGDSRLTINTGKLRLDDMVLGDSIAVNGVCLTAVELGTDYFCADVSNETLSRTILKSATAGTPVNLELALTPSTRMGGHIVSGHVDGIGQVIEKKADGRSFRFKFKAPDTLAKYIAEKGS